MAEVSDGCNDLWVDDFIKEIRKVAASHSNDEKSRRNEISMRFNNFPNKLYRYRSITPQELDTFFGTYDSEIKKYVSHVYLAHPKTFSDDDCLSFLSLENTETWNLIRGMRDYCVGVWGKERFKELFENCHDSDMKKMFDNVCNLFREVASDDKNCMDITAQYQQIQTSSKEKEEREPYVEFLSQQLFNGLGICCFTTSPKSSFLWKKFSNHDKDNELENGMCLEYDMSSINRETKCIIFPVYYSEEIPDISPIILEELGDYIISYNYLALEIIITKRTEFWKEREWRLAVPQIVPDDKGCLYKFPKPSAIFLGSNVSLKDQMTVLNLAKKASIRLIKLKKIDEDCYSETVLYNPLTYDTKHRRYAV